ncbi:MAG: flavin reductase family protein, partial [Nanoarchaeota archaeon]|nr:flavin reductase family protein [Nanoarchaeota archaeon]
KDNIFTLAWHCPISFEPMMYGISVGKDRYSLGLIRTGKVFVVNFMPFEKATEVLFCGRHSGKHTDKFKESGLMKEEADNIDCPRIKEALGYLECEVTDEFDLGDHVFIVGKVLKAKSLRGQRVFYAGDNQFTTTLKP